jgi:hypothetical protein
VKVIAYFYFLDNEIFITMENAKFKIGTDGVEISGPQKFVEDQIDKFKNLIESSYEKIIASPSPRPLHESDSNKRKLTIPQSVSKAVAQQEDVMNHENNGGEFNYENVFAIENDTIQLNCDIPGDSTRAKMLNFVFIYMRAKLLQNIDTVSYADLRDAGTKYIEFDVSNFSKCIDNNRKFFLITGDRKNKLAKLLRAGIKEADRIILALNQQ